MRSILDALMLGGIVADIVLIGYLQLNRALTRLRPTWLQFAAAGSALALAAAVADRQVTTLASLALALMWVVYGHYVLRDVRNRQTTLWLLVGAGWLLLLLLTAVLLPTTIIGQPDWLLHVFSTPDWAGIILLTGLALATLLLAGLAFYGFYAALLPEVANRTLFWVLNSVVLAIGMLLFLSATLVLQAAGVVMMAITLLSAAYAHSAYRVFDIRRAMSSVLRMLLRVTFVSIVIFLALVVADQPMPETRMAHAFRLLTIAIVGAVIYVVLRKLGKIALGPLFHRGLSPTGAARQYSQQVSRAVELGELVRISSDTLNRVLAVRRSGLILVNDTSSDPNLVEVVVMGDSQSGPEIKGTISRTGPVYDRLAVRKQPLSQFDLAFAPTFQQLDRAERRFFDNLEMRAYAPIIVDQTLIGMLMCGPKVNDAPFSAVDLELLATMADQTGVALRNARAMADLQKLNTTMQTLNAELGDANQQYEKLDSVKTDFITIASHELRTPLAQIRGYTDILDTLNEQGMLDQDQIAGMVNSLRRAAERTEELLAAMLDVSQIDVNAMDLRFAEAAPESVLRMAIEPLTEPIKQRRLTLAARGLRALPPIHCDMQRLVQAFRNLITNAIKFTPDDGRIDITASFQPGENEHDAHVLISIADTGVGIEKEDLELIFEKFYRAYDPSTHSTGAYKFMGAGPGLGLTIARGVIEGHGGRVWAESSGHNMETCPGSTFYVLLPIHPPEDTRRVAIDDTQASKNLTPARRPLA